VIGAEVINVQFVDGNRSRAVVTFSSPEGTDKILVHIIIASYAELS